MAEEDAVAGRTRREGRPIRIAAVATAVLAVVLPVAVGLVARRLDDEQWQVDDWGALVTSVLLGSLFFVLTLVVGDEGQRRARAVADAELMTTIGALQMSSARSFAGLDQQALRISAHARAALRHYPDASDAEQKSLVTTISNAYSDLVFGTFSRADALPRSVWNELLEGAGAVAAEASSLAARLNRRSTAQREALDRLAGDICFASSVGAEVRALHRPPLAGQRRVLDCAWEEVAARDPEADAAADRESIRKERLRWLYQRELTVKKDWELLLRSSSISCRVVLQDLAGTESWYAPWYVTDRPPPLHPVNVLFDDLDEAAATDSPADAPGLERYPNPIRHGAIPRGMRSQAVADLRDLLSRQAVATVCVLAYDVVVDERTTKRLVLDGNHRLAAARALARDRRAGRRWSRRPDRATDVRVLTFLLSENEPVDDLTADPDEGPEDRRFPDWRGFSPDIGLVRGTWRPPRYERLTAGLPLD